MLHRVCQRKILGFSLTCRSFALSLYHESEITPQLEEDSPLPARLSRTYLSHSLPADVHRHCHDTFVIDALIANYEYRQQTKKIFDDLRREHESKEE